MFKIILKVSKALRFNERRIVVNKKTIKSHSLDLDSAGIIYPYVANRNWNSVYRIEAELKEPVDSAALRQAVNDLRNNYPYFFMTLDKTETKYILRDCSFVSDTVYNNFGVVCKPFDLESGKSLVRFIYGKNKIILEMFHSITDGHGAMELMKALLSRYKRASDGLKSVSCEAFCENQSLLESRDDIFDELYSRGGKNISRILSSAYQIKRLKPTDLQYKTLELPCRQVVDSAHLYGVSVAVLICALQIKAIVMSQKNIRGSIRISVPVDLRKIFSFSSCRNSSLYFLVSVKPEETAVFSDLLENVKKQFQQNITAENMQNSAYTNVSSAKLKAFKMLPVPVKKAILKFGYTHLGENQFTATMTDIGVVKFNEDIGKIVDNVYFVLGKQKTKPINIAVTTYNDIVRLVVSYDTDCSDFLDALNSLIDNYVL